MRLELGLYRGGGSSVRPFSRPDKFPHASWAGAGAEDEDALRTAATALLQDHGVDLVLVANKCQQSAPTSDDTPPYDTPPDGDYPGPVEGGRVFVTKPAPNAIKEVLSPALCSMGIAGWVVDS